MNTNTKRIAFIGVLTAALIIAGMLETLLSKSFLQVRFALLTVVIVAVLYLCADNFIMTLLVGGMFGCTSFVLGFITGSEIMVNPLFSIVPRLLTAVVVYIVHKLLGKDKYWKKSIIAGTAALFNSIFVLSFMRLIGGYLSSPGAIKALIYAASIPELLIAIIIVPYVYDRVGKYAKIILAPQPAEEEQKEDKK